MTQTELATILGYNGTTQISTAFRQAAETVPSLIEKTRRGPGIIPDYNWQETEAMLKCLGYNGIQIALIKDNFKEPEHNYKCTKDFMIDGMKEFLERWERDKKNCKCCDCCIFLQGRSITHRTSLARPYCSFYDRMISSMKVTKYGKERKVDIFVDKCDSFQKAEEPLVFYRRT